MTSKCIVWVKTWCSTSCTLKIDHLIADVVCIFVFFQILMWATWCWCWWWWLWEIKITVYLTTLPPCPGHPTDQGRITGLPLPSPFTYRCVWQLANPPQLVTSLESPQDEFVGPRFGPILSGQSHIQLLTLWAFLTQRRRSNIWTWSLCRWKWVPYSRLDLNISFHFFCLIFNTHSNLVDGGCDK